MNKTKLIRSGLCVAVASALCATVSQAGLINLGDGNITLNNGSPLISAGQSATVKYWDTVTSTYKTVSTTAGTFKLNVINPSGTPTTGTIYTYCTDVGIYWQSGQRYEAVQFSDGDANGIRPAWSALTESIENASWLYNTYYSNPNETSYITDAKKAAGMQLAIWKVLYDTVDGTGIINPTAWNTGNLQVTGGTANNANQGVSWASQLLADLNAARANNTFTVYSDTWLHPVNENSQGMIYNDLTPVPEPTTILAGALLLLPFGASTIRYFRKNRAA